LSSSTNPVSELTPCSQNPKDVNYSPSPISTATVRITGWNGYQNLWLVTTMVARRKPHMKN